jgi:hypothetical protein
MAAEGRTLVGSLAFAADLVVSKRPFSKVRVSLGLSRLRRVRSMPARLALPAQPAHDQLGALGTVPASAGGAEGLRRVDPHVQILDGSAGPADEVVMHLGAGVPERRRAAGGHSVCDAHLLEQLECRVDRRERRVREPRLHAGEHLLGAGMPTDIGERAVDEDALGRHSKAAFPQCVFELLISH